MARGAGRAFFQAAKREPFPFSCTIAGDVPVSRGLGSSVTVRLGVLHGLNALSGSLLDRAEIFALCAGLEGHPDNAAPAEFGGFTVARTDRYQHFKVSSRLRFVLLIPGFKVETAAARAALPNELKRVDAVESCGNACAIAAAFASRRYENLHGMWSDHLHQPFRAKFVPFLEPVIAAGEKAGALGGFLSGSGSIVACVTLRAPEKVCDAMRTASGLRKVETRVLTADNDGARIIDSIS